MPRKLWTGWHNKEKTVTPKRTVYSHIEKALVEKWPDLNDVFVRELSDYETGHSVLSLMIEYGDKTVPAYEVTEFVQNLMDSDGQLRANLYNAFGGSDAEPLIPQLSAEPGGYMDPWEKANVRHEEERVKELVTAYRSGDIEKAREPDNYSAEEELYHLLDGKFEGASACTRHEADCTVCEWVNVESENLEDLVATWEKTQPGRIASPSSEVQEHVAKEIAKDAHEVLDDFECDIYYQIDDIEHSAEVAAGVSSYEKNMTLEDAQEVIKTNAEWNQHIQGCPIDVQRCSVCSSAERTSWAQAESNAHQLTAAQNVLRKHSDKVRAAQKKPADLSLA
jgi:hypothetical protein